jgi:hypothetical protein
MEQAQVRRVPVIQEGKVQGMLTLADIARWARGRHSARVPAGEALARALAAICQAPPSEAFGTAQAAE